MSFRDASEAARQAAYDSGLAMDDIVKDLQASKKREMGLKKDIEEKAASARKREESDRSDAKRERAEAARRRSKDK
jgi:hypothetical protein